MNSLKLSKDFFYISPDFVAIPWALKEQANGKYSWNSLLESS